MTKITTRKRKNNLITPGTPERWEVVAHRIMCHIPHFFGVLLALLITLKIIVLCQSNF